MIGIYLAAVAGLSEVSGGMLVVTRRVLQRRVLLTLQAIGAGFMLTLSLVQLIPRAIANGGSTLYTILGFLIIMAVDVYFRGDEGATPDPAHPSPALGMATWGGIMTCAFADGVAIQAASAIGVVLGVLVFLGYFPNKFVNGCTVSSVLASTGFTRRSTAIRAALLGASTVLGAALTALVIQGHALRLGDLLAFSAGILLNVSANEIIPHLRESDFAKQALMLIPAGVLLYLGIAAVLH